MATKTAQCNGSRGQYYGIEMTYVENSTNVTNNTSNITITGKIKATSAGWSYYGFTNTGVIKIDGTQVASGSSSVKVDTNGVTLVTYTGDITHSADGTKTISIQFDFSTTYSYLSNTSVSTSWALSTIPRKSNATLSASTFNIGSSVTLTTNRASNSFTHTVVVAFGGTNMKTYSNVGASQVINTNDFASSMYAKIPNAKSGTGTITTTTYSGNTSLGSTSISFTANAVEANVNPTVGALSYTVDNKTQTLAGNSTTYIANVSTSTISVTVSSRSSATLSKAFLWYYNGSSKQQLVSQNASGTSGTYSFSISSANIKNGIYAGATDSRGYTTYNTTNYAPATYKAYVALTADQTANIARTNQTEAKIKITQFKGSYWTGNFGAQSNTLTITWKYKESTSNSWSTEYTIPSNKITISGTTYTISDYILTDGTTEELFNYQKAWNIQFNVTDKVGTIPASYTITAGVPNFAVFPEVVKANGTAVVNNNLHVGGTGNFGGKITGYNDLSITGTAYTGAGIYTNGKTGGADGNTGIVLTAGGIEISHSSTPYIDFHYANSTADFTSRLFEERSGVLKTSGALLKGGNTVYLWKDYLTTASTNNTLTTKSIHSGSFTSHGGKFIGIAIMGGFKTSAGNSMINITIDGSDNQAMTTSQTSEMPAVGIVAFGTIVAGTHTVSLGHKPNQAQFTSTVGVYKTNILLLFEY